MEGSATQGCCGDIEGRDGGGSDGDHGVEDDVHGGDAVAIDNEVMVVMVMEMLLWQR